MSKMMTLGVLGTLAGGLWLALAAPAPAATEALKQPGLVKPTPALTLEDMAQRELTSTQQLRRLKCDYLWRKLYPWSYKPELVDFFCGEHERAGMAELWWQSLVYGASGSEMRPSMICIGGSMVSRGLMDCAWTFAGDYRQRLEPLLSGAPWGPQALFNPWVSIRCHVLELKYYRGKTGRDDWGLLRTVFLPASPDGGRCFREQRRWERIERRHSQALCGLYAKNPRVAELMR